MTTKKQMSTYGKVLAMAKKGGKGKGMGGKPMPKGMPMKPGTGKKGC